MYFLLPSAHKNTMGGILKRYFLFSVFITVCLILTCCKGAVHQADTQSQGTSITSAESYNSIDGSPTTINYAYIRGIWVSQFDMHYIYTDKGVQRDKDSYTALVKTMLQNIKSDNFNTIYLQLRPNGDSMYSSELYPVSRYVSGAYGRELTYDAVGIFIEEAHALSLSVQGWINPLRLMTENELDAIDRSFLIKKWFSQKSNKVVEVNGRLYLNPAYEEVRKLIIDGASEIMERYDIDGIHMDDYFYPTTDKSFDEGEFLASGYDDIGKFRRNNINLLVKGLYEAVKAADNSAQYGISPAGNLKSLLDYYYADVYLWCSVGGYIDYIMPQLYYGFLNKSCPFDKTLSDWAGVVTNPSVSLIIGLTAGKPVLATTGEIDVWAGTDEGKKEWINNKDILKRSLTAIYNEEKTNGYCFFCYQYLYDVITGEPNAAFSQERDNIGELLYYYH